VLLVLVAFSVTGCPRYKPYLPEQYRGDAQDPDSSIPGIFTGKKREYVIYGQ
jgi:hypothetical protein